MLKKLGVVAAILCAAAFNQGFAEEAKSTQETNKSNWENFKEKFDLLIVNETGTATTKDSSVYNDTVMYFKYKPTKNDTFRTYVEYWRKNTNVNDENAEFSGRYEASELMYRRSNILTEKEHGVGMSADLRFAHYGNAIQESAALGWRNVVDTRINLSKSTGTISNSLTLRASEYLMEDSNKSDAQYKRTYQVYLSQAYNITDKVSVSNLFLYRRYFNTQNNVESNTASEYLRMYPTIGYSFDNGFNVETYYRMVPFTRKQSHGHMVYNKDIFKNGLAAVAVSYSAF